MDAGRRFVFDVEVSPNGEWAATGSQDGSVRVFDWRTGRVIQRWTHTGNDPEAIGWLDDRRLVFSAQSGRWEVYEVGSPERVGLIAGQGDAYAFDRHGDWLFAAGNAHNTCAWSIADPSSPAWCDSLDGSGNTVVPLPGGRLFEASYGAELRVLEASTGAVLARSTVAGIAFGRGAVSPDGGDVALTVRADDGSTSLVRMRIPRGDAAAAPPAEVVWSTPGDRALSVDWSPDGATLAAATINGAIALYDASTGRLLAQTHAHHPSAWRAVFVDGGRALLSVGSEGILRTWELSDARPPLAAPPR
jgi:WD40 repeat protein